MTELQKGVQNYMKTGDNVALVNTLKSDMYSKLSENPQFAELAGELEKYSSAFDADPDYHSKIDDLTK